MPGAATGQGSSLAEPDPRFANLDSEQATVPFFGSAWLEESDLNADYEQDTAVGPGDRIGRYIVIERIGAGAMGVVYKANDPALKRHVAIKLLRPRPESAHGTREISRIPGEEVDFWPGGAVARPDIRSSALVREARALAKLSHPNIVAVYDVGRFRARVFVALELIEGQSVQRWLARDRPSLWQVVDVFIAAGRGLAAAHRVGLIHRDFKPSNVIVGNDGRVRVLDFGLARAAETTDLPGRDSIAGTPAYMAPEQRIGHNVSPRSDQYSFCVALHEALFGMRPSFRPDETLLGAKPGDLVESGQQHFAAVPALLQRVLLRGLAPDPDQRYSSMDALVTELARLPASRRIVRTVAVACLALSVFLVAALGWNAWRADRERAHRRALEQAASRQLDTVTARIETLYNAGKLDEADDVFFAFDRLDEYRGTWARARAWLDRAERIRRLDRPDHRHRLRVQADAGAARFDRALTAYANAHLNAVDEDQHRQSLLGLARAFEERWSWRELDLVLSQFGARIDDAEIVQLRLRSALVRRDFDAALTLWQAVRDAGPGATALPDDLAPVVRALSSATPTTVELDRAVTADVDGDEIAELVVYRDRDQSIAALRANPQLTPLWSQERVLGPVGSGEVGGENGAAGDSSGEVRGLWVLPRRSGALPYLLTYSRRPGQRMGTATLFSREQCDDRPDGCGLAVVHRWRDEQINVAASLGGPGLASSDDPGIYIGNGPYRRQLYRLEPRSDGGWQEVEVAAGIDELGSDIRTLFATDLDGDGGREVVIAMGPWRAYDLRVLRPVDRMAGRTMRLVDRKKLGYLVDATAIRTNSGTGILALKDDKFPSRRVFPAASLFGQPAGLYSFLLEDDELVQTGHVPTPKPLSIGDPLDLVSLVTADIDGDGLDDAVVNLHSAQHGSYALIGRQRSDGSFATLLVGHMQVMAAIDVDEDPADELVIRFTDLDQPAWLLGVGSHSVPVDRIHGERRVADQKSGHTDPRRGDESASYSLPEPRAGPSDRPDPDSEHRTVGAGQVPDALRHDEALARLWMRAEQLVAMGLLPQAAKAFEDLATLSRNPRAQHRALYRAGRLWQAAGNDARAATRYRDAAASPELANRALAAALAAYRREYRFAAALALADQLLARVDLSTVMRAEIERWRRIIEPLARPRQHIDIVFDHYLDPAWRISDPLALQRDARHRALRVHSFGETRELASLPMLATDNRISLAVDIEVTRSEWASGVRIILQPHDSASSSAGNGIGVGIKAVGGGGLLDRRIGWYVPSDTRWHGMSQHGLDWPVRALDERMALSIEIDVVPDLSEALCQVIGEAGEVLYRSRIPWNQGPVRGRYELRIDADGEPGFTQPVLMSLWIHRIAVTGMRLDPTRYDRDQVLAHTRRAVVEGDPGSALTAFDALRDTRPHLLDPDVHGEQAVLTQLGALLAAHTMGRHGDAVDIARELVRVAGDPDKTPILDRYLGYLMRLPDSDVEPLLRDVLGSRYYALYWQSWQITAQHHEADPAIIESLTSQLGGIHRLDARSLGAAGTYIKRWLLLHRAQAFWQLGKPGPARRDVEQFLQISRRPGPAGSDVPDRARELVASACRLLAAIEASAGNSARALHYAEKSLGVARVRDIAVDRLLLYPELATMIGQPSWQTVFGR